MSAFEKINLAEAKHRIRSSFCVRMLMAGFLLLLPAWQMLAQSAVAPDARSQKVDSAILKVNQVSEKTQVADSTIDMATHKADTVIDAADEALEKLNGVLDLPEKAATNATDSLQWLKKAYSAEQRTIDSLNRLVNTPADKIEGVEGKLENPTIGRANEIGSEVNEGLSNVGINHSVDRQDGIGISDQMRQERNNGLLPDLPKVPGLDAGSGALDQLNQADQLVDKAKGISEQTKNISVEVGSLSKGDLENTEAISGMAESQLRNTDVFKTLAAEKGAFGEMGGPSGQFALPSEKKLQEQALALARQETLDRFAAHRKRVEGAMSEINKLKHKYSEVESYKDKKMVKAASFKGKPWQQRVYPSLLFQVLNGEQVVVDFRPGVHYRVYGRWTLNGGAVFRQHFSKNQNLTLPIYNITGGFLSTEFTVWKSLAVFQMTQLVDVKRQIPESVFYSRYADWDIIAGIKKDFRFTKHLKGTSQAGYNFMYDHFSSPYGIKWHLMFGLYYKFKVKDTDRKKGQAPE